MTTLPSQPTALTLAWHRRWLSSAHTTTQRRSLCCEYEQVTEWMKNEVLNTSVQERRPGVGWGLSALLISS